MSKAIGPRCQGLTCAARHAPGAAPSLQGLARTFDGLLPRFDAFRARRGVCTPSRRLSA